MTERERHGKHHQHDRPELDGQESDAHAGLGGQSSHGVQQQDPRGQAVWAVDEPRRRPRHHEGVALGEPERLRERLHRREEHREQGTGHVEGVRCVEVADRPVEATDLLSTCLLISKDHLTQLFGVELFGERG